MAPLLALSRGIDWCTEWIGRLAGYSILVSILISVGNALVRKFAPQYSSNAWLEAQWYLFGAAFMLASAYTLQKNEHIRIDLLYGSLKRSKQHWIDLFGHVFFLLPFCLLMLYYLLPWARRSMANGEVSPNAGGLLIWPAKMIILGGFVLLALQCLSEIIKKVAVMRGKMEDPTPYVSAHEASKAEAEALIEEMKK